MTVAPDFDAPDFVIGIVGAGAMGRGIAQVAAAGGFNVRITDAAPEVAEASVSFASQMLRRAAEKDRMTPADAEAAIARMTVVPDIAGLAGCAVVIEAIVEDLDAKRHMFAELENAVSASCILASNTSSLSVTAIASACENPERVAGFHFFNPVPLMRVVEVIAGQRTRADACDTLSAIAERFGHKAVRAMDTPGFLVNHAGRAYATEALAILGEGVAEPVDVDRIMRDAAGFRMGPFELFDLTGLDVSHPVMESIFEQFYADPRYRPSPETRRRLSAGLLGRKSAAGFYRYADGKPETPPEPPAPEARPERVWVSGAEADGRARVLDRLATLNVGVELEDGAAPSEAALCLTTPLGADATTSAIRQGLDPVRTVAIDTVVGLDKRVTLMANPLTTRATREAACGLFAATGAKVTLIADSPGFVAQRVLAAIVNLGCAIAQAGIAVPDDIDDAVRLGLGYPQGPLDLGDSLGAGRVLTILENLRDATGDPRYRPSPWLRRRVQLGLSLKSPDVSA